MWKLLLVLIVGLVFESIGVVCLKKGITEMGEMKTVSVAEVIRMVKSGVTNLNILLGVFFEALFFGCLLLLLSRGDVSFIWPLTSLSFVFATIAAMIFLHETVSSVRWIGVLLIMIGAGLISYSEKQKEKEKAAASATAQVEQAPAKP